MKKLFLLIVFAFAFLNLTKANVAADSIQVKAGSELIIDSCALVSAKLILEPGSKLVISNGGTLITLVSAKFFAPIGATVDIISGTVM